MTKQERAFEAAEKEATEERSAENEKSAEDERDEKIDGLAKEVVTAICAAMKGSPNCCKSRATTKGVCC